MQEASDVGKGRTTPASDRDAGDAPGGGGDASAESATAVREGGGGGGGGGDASGEASAPKRQRMGGKSEAELLAKGDAAGKIAAPECVLLQSSPSDMLAIFRQLARAPCDSQREDDDAKRSLLEALRLRHEYATHPEGWVARRKRSSREVVARWGVTDSGALRSRVGANYQATDLPECTGAERYVSREDEFCKTAFIANDKTHSKATLDSYLAGLQPLYQDYVLDRRETKTSHRDIGTFYEHALNQLHSHKGNTKIAASAVEKCMQHGDAFESEYPYEVWNMGQAQQYRNACEKHHKEFYSIMAKFMPTKPVKGIISYYYRSKHVDNACRRGPMLLVGNVDEPASRRLEMSNGEPDQESGAVVISQAEVTAYNWLQIKCRCRRWLRVLERFRYLYQVCPDCESTIAVCPGCSVPSVLPKIGRDEAQPPSACPNCTHQF